MLFDTHCHLNFNIFRNDYYKIIQKCFEQDIWVLIIGTNKNTSLQAAKIANKYIKGVYAAIGLHPIHLIKQKIIDKNFEFTTSGEDFDPDFYENLFISSLKGEKTQKDFVRDKTKGRVVAIGETGLDYFYKIDEHIKILQTKVFIEHLKLADKLQLPVIIHARGSKDFPLKVYDDLFEILHNYKLKSKSHLKGIIHSFFGNLEQAKKFIDIGFLLGFNAGIFQSNLDEVIKNIDINKIVLETDSPYFYPDIKNSNQRNEPINVKFVCEYIAKLKNISIYEVSSITTNNVLNLFDILI